MKVYVESVLDCQPERAWDEVQKSSLLLEVIRPLARLAPVGTPALPDRWAEGAVVRCRTYLLGFVPVGVHTVGIERVDPAARVIQSREHDPLIRRWDHRVRVEPTGDGRTRYSDEIEIEAGALTAVAWLFARFFYRHRHRRWRRVAERLAAA